MAEGLARTSAPPGWRIFSAGSKPSIVNPLAIEALHEIDIDISAHRSKGLDDVPLDEADLVVTLCDDEVCPVVPQRAEHLDWAMPDPAGAGDQIRFQMDAFREIRDQIKKKLEVLWKDKTAQ
jgi:arsenate reductase